MATLDDIRANDGNLSIPLYVRKSALREDNAAYDADELAESVAGLGGELSKVGRRPS